MAELEIAANLFPFNRTIRTRPGYAAMELPATTDTVRIIGYTIANDRHSTDLVSAYIRHRLLTEGK